VDLPRRPAATIEAVAYFVVSETLTNITKHAQASQAEVVVQRIGDRLHIIVSDDGVGVLTRPAAPAWPGWPSAPPRSTGRSRSPARPAARP
jgi:signal transduction histidine kinase